MVRIQPSNDQQKSYRRRRRKLKTPSSIKEILGAASSGALVTLLTSSLLWSSGDLEQIRIQRQSFLRRSNLNPFLLQKNVVDNALYGNRLIVPAAETNHKHDDRHSNSAYDHIWPKVAWLMSFPNSGTSFTLQYTRSATNTSTATNYGKEGDIHTEDSVPIHQSLGSEGPWLLRYPEQPTKLPQHYILTKTHCSGVCDGDHCVKPASYLETSRSFRRSCQQGTKAIYDSINDGIELVPSMYDEAIVHKAIHMMRNPYDNIVARFHLVWKRETRKDDSYADKFPNTADGFRAWCRERDAMTDFLEDPWLSKVLQDVKLDDFFCHQEFLLYIQWHNLAFEAIRELGIPTLVILYEDYATDFDLASRRLLHFLQLQEEVVDGDDDDDSDAFKAGKTYLDFYSPTEKASIAKFLFELASDDTWEYLQGYFTEQSS